jgi:hypothetical protein
MSSPSITIVRRNCEEADSHRVRREEVLRIARIGRRVVYSAVVWRSGIAVVSIHSFKQGVLQALDHDTAVAMQRGAQPSLFAA